MGHEQWLFLQWHEHKGSLVSTFEKLFERNTFVDCTLAAEGQYLNVHKMILSACSPYFEILLNENRDKHPIIILKDVKFRSLKSIIEYMYRGEANVMSSEMSDFLAAAETLQIKGLGKQGGGDTRNQPTKNLLELVDEQPLPPCPRMQIINEEKDNWGESDLSSTLTETVQESFIAQKDPVLLSQGDAGAPGGHPQRLPKGGEPAAEAEADSKWVKAEEADAAAGGLCLGLGLGLGSHSIEPVRPAAGDATVAEAVPKAEGADADLHAPAPAIAPAPAPGPGPGPAAGLPPADLEEAETASLGSSVIELSDTTEEWAEEDMEEAQTAPSLDTAPSLAPATDESRARYEVVSDPTRESVSRDVGSEQGAAATTKHLIQRLLTVLGTFQSRIQECGIPFDQDDENEAQDGSVEIADCQLRTRDAYLDQGAGEGSPSSSRAGPRLQPQRHFCPLCRKSFPWLSSLKRHMECHKAEVWYTCDECGFSTKKLGNLTKHQRVHSHKNFDPPRTYFCPVCRESFSWLCDLKRHMHTHTLENLYKCEECGFMTKQFKNFSSHKCMKDAPVKYTHTVTHSLVDSAGCLGSRSWSECSGSTEGFRREETLESLTDTEQQLRYKCKMCGAKFAQMGQLIQHINCEHGFPVQKEDLSVASSGNRSSGTSEKLAPENDAQIGG